MLLHVHSVPAVPIVIFVDAPSGRIEGFSIAGVRDTKVRFFLGTGSTYWKVI
eukprot:SAG31_NODE_1114_length_9852_cov_2.761509_8_plen_52_part_00